MPYGAAMNSPTLADKMQKQKLPRNERVIPAKKKGYAALAQAKAIHKRLHGGKRSS